MAALLSSSGPHSAAVTPCIHHTKGKKNNLAVRVRECGVAAISCFFPSLALHGAPLIDVWKLEHAAVSAVNPGGFQRQDDVR